VRLRSARSPVCLKSFRSTSYATTVLRRLLRQINVGVLGVLGYSVHASYNFKVKDSQQRAHQRQPFRGERPCVSVLCGNNLATLSATQSRSDSKK
jgi:hypothetical protein